MSINNKTYKLIWRRLGFKFARYNTFFVVLKQLQFRGEKKAMACSGE